MFVNGSARWWHFVHHCAAHHSPPQCFPLCPMALRKLHRAFRRDQIEKVKVWQESKILVPEEKRVVASFPRVGLWEKRVNARELTV